MALCALYPCCGRLTAALRGPNIIKLLCSFGADAGIWVERLLLLGVEACEGLSFLRRQAVGLGCCLYCLYKECHISSEISHCLEPFKIVLYIGGGEAVHFIPIGGWKQSAWH